MRNNPTSHSRNIPYLRIIAVVLAVASVLLLVSLVTVNRGQANVPTVCLDPGHGGIDGGAVNTTYQLAEDDVVLDIAGRTSALLLQSGYNVIMTRETAEEIPTHWQRILTCRGGNADVLISIHLNSTLSSDVDGSMVLYEYQMDKPLAEAIHSRMYPAINQHPATTWEMYDLGVRYYDAAVLRWWPYQPGVLIEPLMLSHDGQAALLLDDGPVSRRQLIAETLFAGIDAYFKGLAAPTAVPTNTVNN